MKLKRRGGFKVNKMKKLLMMSACLLALAISVTSAQASLITINSGNSPKPANSGDATITEWLLAGVTDYNAANNPDLPDPGAQLFRVNTLEAAPDGYPTFKSETKTINIPTGGYDYVAFHWGGKGGGTYQSFYIGSIGGATANPTAFTAPGQNGLSWYSLFRKSTGSPVPDGGMTIALLGLGMAGMGFIARRKA